MIELPEGRWIEDNRALRLAIQAHGHLPVVDRSDGAKIPVSDTKLYWVR